MRHRKATFVHVALACTLLFAGLPVWAATESLPAVARTEIHGAHTQERLGASVQDAGDFNGDGFGDLVAGGRGRAYVVLGGAEGKVSLEDPNRGIEMSFAVSDRQHRFVVAGLHDVNGDGLDDVAVGVAQADPLAAKNAGSVFVVFGRRQADPVVLDPVPGPGVIRIDGAAQGDRAGTAVASAGDVDGDEIPDLLVGSPRADDGSDKRRGAAYVLFGHSLDHNINLGRLTSEGYRMDRPNFGRDVGKSVSAAGDMNEDGLNDVIVGVPSSLVLAPPAAYVVFGQAGTHPIALGNLYGRGWLITAGEKENEEGAGEAVGGGHDVNGDGVPDVVVGAPGAAGPFERGGAAFVVFGKADSSVVTLDALGDSGFRIEGGERSQDVGRAVALIPDQDGNGLADVLVGAPYEQRGPYGESDQGVLYHLVGQSSTERIGLGRLGSAGVRYAGKGYEEAGSSVAAVASFHGDGALELVTGAPRADTEAGDDAGRVYVFSPLPAPEHDNPPRAVVISYTAPRKAKIGSYCWDGVCEERAPEFSRLLRAGTRNRAHFRIMFPHRPDSFSLQGYRSLDEDGRPAGPSSLLDSNLEPVRLYQGATISSYEATFRLPRGEGDLYLVGSASWSGSRRGDVTWFSHLRLSKQDRQINTSSPPDMTLLSKDLRRSGSLTHGYCWSQGFSDGTGVTMCVDLAPRLNPLRAAPAHAGASARIRIHNRHRPDKIRFLFQRQLSDYYTPAGPARRVPYRFVPVRRSGRLAAWDLAFRLPRRPGHLYPSVRATWGHQDVMYDWHLRLR